MSAQQTNSEMLHTVNEKVDQLIRSHNHLNATYEADMREVKDKLTSLHIEDIRIDNKFTLVASNTKAYIAGIATAFSVIGAAFGAAMTYIFGVK